MGDVGVEDVDIPHLTGDGLVENPMDTAPRHHHANLDGALAVQVGKTHRCIADLHENILAVKADGPTKEDFAWGLRCGFLTFGCKNYTEAQYEGLVKKVMGVIRSSVSCSSTPSQTLVLHAFEDKNNDAEKLAFRKILEKRYRLVRNFVDTHKSDAIEAMPFNSGYFMSFKMNGINAEQLRKKLLAEKGIGTISIDDNTLRVAFSSIEENLIEKVYSDIYQVAEELKRA